MIQYSETIAVIDIRIGLHDKKLVVPVGTKVFRKEYFDKKKNKVSHGPWLIYDFVNVFPEIDTYIKNNKDIMYFLPMIHFKAVKPKEGKQNETKS